MLFRSRIFGDRALAERLAGNSHVVLSSANSINVGRLVPQVVYYFSAYAQLLADQVINVGDEVEFVVPTGNFGDILAGYYAKLLPEEKVQRVQALQQQGHTVLYAGDGINDAPVLAAAARTHSSPASSASSPSAASPPVM